MVYKSQFHLDNVFFLLKMKKKATRNHNTTCTVNPTKYKKIFTSVISYQNCEWSEYLKGRYM